MSKKIDSRLPFDIGKGQLPDNAAIKTPWEKLISLYDANYYVCRHRAGVGGVFMEVLRILIPDYATRCKRLCDCAGNFYHYIFDPEGPYNMAESSSNAMLIHPFMRGEFICGACGDNGDESLWMCGRVTDFSTHRIEKELDTCPWDILGSEICRTSTWAGMEVIGQEFAKYNGGGPKIRVSMYEAKGVGDLHCRIVGESYEKYPMPPRENWDNFGPISTEDQIKYTPEEKCLKDCQIYRADAGFKFRTGLCNESTAAEANGNAAGGGYEMSSSSNLGCNYVQWVLDDMLAKGEVTREQLSALFENVFEACGKMMFLDYFAIKGVRDWLGVPNDVNDGRTLGAYIEVYLQAIKSTYDVVAFNKDEVIYDIDIQRFELGISFMKDAYIPMWYGMSKTLVGSQWALWEEKEDVPEGKFRIKIAKKIDKECR
jgi:hypothetical protein